MALLLALLLSLLRCFIEMAASQAGRQPRSQRARRPNSWAGRLANGSFWNDCLFINKVNNASYQSVDAALVRIVYQYITDTFWRYARCGKRQASWSLRSYVPLLEVAGQLVVSGRIFSYSVAVCALAAAP